MSDATRVSGDLHIGLATDARAAVTAVLNALLADEFMLYSRARAFHWNVTGRHFSSDHKLFEDEYEALDEIIDDVAERTRALGGKVPARLADYVEHARLEDVESRGMSAEAMIASLRDGHEAIIRQLRADTALADQHGDEGTADFLTGLMEGHEKRAWMLRSHLEG